MYGTMILGKLKEYYEKLRIWHFDNNVTERWIIEDLHDILENLIPTVSSKDSETMITLNMTEEEQNKRLEKARKMIKKFKDKEAVEWRKAGCKGSKYFLRVWRGWFDHMLTGQKTFDARRRESVDDLRLGDKVCFQEYDQKTGRHTGRYMLARVMFVGYTKDFDFWPDRVEALKEADLCIFSFRSIRNVG